MEGALIFLIVLAALIVLRRKVFMLNVVSGRSMSETLHDGDIIVSAPTRGDISRFHVVLCFYNGDRREKSVAVRVLKGFLSAVGEPSVRKGKRLCVKRVIGLPGETVSASEGKIMINSLPLDDPYDDGNAVYSFRETVLDKESYFVMGDNRKSSRDSRSPAVGPVRMKDIIAETKYVIFPPGRIRRLF